VLIAIFTLLPYLSIHGRPAFLLNIPAREFTLFGFTFLPTDTLLLALLLVSLIVGIFLATALFGRVWCGWMCPQTVYLEFVYRPLERLFDGPPGPRHAPGKRATPLRTIAKYAVYLLISAYLAHTFLAYFVGVGQLTQWVQRSPLDHPASFLVMLVTTGAMVFDFVYFREQTCIVACPYGRFQSVMLDRNSLIVSYDLQRGEPRARGHRKAGDGRGDCVDCGGCTDTCPTGIDIRGGLQMECIACTQCIDACDGVMERLGKPRGLIRFSSQARMAGEVGRWLRPRVLVYPAIIVALLSAFGVILAHKQSADVTLLRGLGRPFDELTPGEITNQLRVKIRNRSGDAANYAVALVEPPDGRLTLSSDSLRIPAGESRTEPVSIVLPRSAFRQGHCDIRLRVTAGQDFVHDMTYRLLGPQG
jgi:cytochrome c oxidase accessory protein FixG